MPATERDRNAVCGKVADMSEKHLNLIFKSFIFLTTEYKVTINFFIEILRKMQQSYQSEINANQLAFWFIAFQLLFSMHIYTRDNNQFS